LIIDEPGYLSMPTEDAAALFQVISRRYLRGSVILTTNKMVASWGDIFSDTTIAAAMLDRLLHKSVVIHIDGVSRVSFLAQFRGWSGLMVRGWSGIGRGVA